jgi:hypothetical protein
MCGVGASIGNIRCAWEAMTTQESTCASGASAQEVIMVEEVESHILFLLIIFQQILLSLIIYLVILHLPLWMGDLC